MSYEYGHKGVPKRDTRTPDLGGSIWIGPGAGGESGRWREENSQTGLWRDKGIARGCSSQKQRKSRGVVPQRENMLATRVKI